MDYFASFWVAGVLIWGAALPVLAVETAAAKAAAASPTVTLAGHWAGKWVDGRESYGGNGGDFTCDAVDVSAGKWAGTFSLGSTKTYKVDLSGKVVDGVIRFDTTADLGKFHGIYVLKGTVTRDVFLGDYSGKDERGTFKMTRVADVKLEGKQ